jgi:di/tripeptidase
MPSVPANSSATGAVQLNIDGINVGELVDVAHGQAKIATSFSDNATHTVKAIYWGDRSYDESVSETLQVTAN